MRITEMDPEVAWQAIEGYSNELAAEVHLLEARYRQMVCPQCKGPGRKEINVRFAFSDPEVAVPRALLRCQTCGCLYNPHYTDTRGRSMVVETGDPRLIVLDIKDPYSG